MRWTERCPHVESGADGRCSPSTRLRSQRDPVTRLRLPAVAGVAVAIIIFVAGPPRRDTISLAALVLAVAIIGFASGVGRLRAAPRRDPTAKIVIVGNEDHCRRVRLAAVGHRRVAAEWCLPAAGQGPPPGDFLELLEQLSRADELVVDAGSFARFRESVEWEPRWVAGVRVVPDACPIERLLANPLSPPARFAKRTFDIVFSLVALSLAAPCLLATMLAIRVDSSGPTLFKQVRAGEGGRRFTLYKFRTMTAGDEDPAVLAYLADMVRGQAEPENGMFKLGSNRRITRVGRLLRRLSIDEVPQFWNVLKGEMSVIGPRPVMVEESACYNDFHWQRLAVRPGITGLAQVSGRSRLRFDDIVALDIRYSRSWTVGLELGILVRTPAAILSGRGAT